MLASSWADPVLGIDVHWEFVPTPAPVPTPIPNPFTGVVFDPAGLAISLALTNAIAAVMGGPAKGPVLYWGLPATNTGTEARHVPGHIIIPPGTSWAPVPKTPKPAFKGTPKPEKPVTPSNDAVVITGSKTVHVMGSNAARLGDLLLSCSEPVRLPSSVILAVPKGAPILIGGPPALDIMAAVLASIRTRFIGDSLQAGISRLPIGARGRAVLSWIACKLTGHPVDVATGKVMTRFLDAELPGPLPLRIERFYLSNFASRSGPLGYGWSSSLDQAVWEERGKVVCLLEDGREIEFDTFDLPGRTMQVGDEVWHPIDRLTLRREPQGRWRLTGPDGITREFAALAGARDTRARITRIASRDGFHEIGFHYDGRGCLERVRDSAGRLLRCEHDARGRLVELKLPLPHDRGWYVHRRYEYDADGDLRRVVDAEDHAWTFEYATHLLVREVDRTGLGFCFEYDGLGADAWCTRTWGDGGTLDRSISYDKQQRVTFVSNSLGECVQYRYNEAGAVTRTTEPDGSFVETEYDPVSFQPTRERTAAGVVFERTYDAHARLVRETDGAGAAVDLRYDAEGNCVALRDAVGGVWEWAYDGHGQLVARTTSLGETTRFEWDGGLLASVTSPGGSVTRFEYDESRQLALIRDPGGTVTTCSHDRLGRLQQARDPRSATVRAAYDMEGRTIAMRTRLGTLKRWAYDAEGNVLAVDTAGGTTRFEYDGSHRLTGRVRGGEAVSFRYNDEGDLTALVNERGEAWSYRYDAVGRVIGETAFHGSERAAVRDVAGRIVECRDAEGGVTRYTRDPVGRVVRVDHADGTFSAFEYRQDGALLRATNEYAEIRYERDARGRVIAETRDAFTVRSQYTPEGQRRLLESTYGARLEIQRDPDGYVRRIAVGRRAVYDWDAHITFENDPLGAELVRTTRGGVDIVWDRDASGRPLAQRVSRGGREEFSSLSYRWRDEERIDAIVDAARGARSFLYDDRGRLIAADIAGTRQERGGLAGIHPGAARGRGGRVEQHDGTALRYDGNGRLVERETSDGRRWAFHWNGHGLLRRVDLPGGRAMLFEYDAFARRTRKTLVRVNGDAVDVEHDVQFLWDGHTVLHEVSSDGAPVTWYWEPGLFTPLARERGDEVWTAVTDHLGTPASLLDGTGTIRWSAEHDVNGRAAVREGRADDCPWRWPGQYEDLETGLHYNRFRYYDPDTGAYISPDPLAPLSGTSEYAYVADSVAWCDPLGLIQVQQVPYDGHPMFGEPGGVRDFVRGQPPSAIRSRNIASALLDDGTVITRASQGGGVHAERVVMDAIPPGRTVVAFYTERAPCSGRIDCHGMLDSRLPADTPVFYTFEHVRGMEGQTAREIQEARRTHCGG